MATSRGYVLYPPVTPFLARIELALFRTSLLGFRFFPAIASGLVTVLTGLTARAMGGGPQAMLMSAFAASIAGPVFFSGSFMSYMSFDLLWWVMAAWCVARLIESGDARWWLGVGAAIGLGLMTKYTMAFFAVALLGAMLLTPNRHYLRSAWFWCGVALALLLLVRASFHQPCSRRPTRKRVVPVFGGPRPCPTLFVERPSHACSQAIKLTWPVNPDKRWALPFAVSTTASGSVVLS
jgi:hypothetical protein